MSLLTLKRDVNGRPSLVDASDIAAVDIEPLATNKMQGWLSEQGYRMVCGSDSCLHVRKVPQFPLFDGPEAA